MPTRTWIDPRDGIEWEIEVVPMMERMAPGKAIPMIGPGSKYRVWFRSKRDSHFTTAEFEEVARLDELPDEALAGLLDRARRG